MAKAKFVIDGEGQDDIVVSLRLQKEHDGAVSVMAKNNLNEEKCLVQFKDGRLHVIGYSDMEGITTKGARDRISTVNQ